MGKTNRKESGKSKIIEKIKEYYSIEGNGAGGNLHIVTDDGNLDDDCIKFCIRRCVNKKDKLGEKIGNELLNTPLIERAYIYTEFWKNPGF